MKDKHFLCMAYPDSEEDAPAECVALITLDHNMYSVILPTICDDVEHLSKKYDTDTLLLEMADDCVRFFDETELDMPEVFSSLLGQDDPITFHELLYAETPRELSERELEGFMKCVEERGSGAELKDEEFRFLVARKLGVSWEIGGTDYPEQHTATLEWQQLTGR